MSIVILKVEFFAHLRIQTKNSKFFPLSIDTKMGVVATGVPNTEMGHCEKTIKILQLLDTELAHNKSLSGIQWVVLADDDTILR